MNLIDLDPRILGGLRIILDYIKKEDGEKFLPPHRVVQIAKSQKITHEDADYIIELLEELEIGKFNRTQYYFVIQRSKFNNFIRMGGLDNFLNVEKDKIKKLNTVESLELEKLNLDIENLKIQNRTLKFTLFLTLFGLVFSIITDFYINKNRKNKIDNLNFRIDSIIHSQIKTESIYDTIPNRIDSI